MTFQDTTKDTTEARGANIRRTLTAPDESDPGSSAESWTVFDHDVYGCEVWVEEETDGIFVAFAARLPGVVAQADGFDRALEEIEQALSATIASYLDRGELIPWTEEPIESEVDCPVTKRWLLVGA